MAKKDQQLQMAIDILKVDSQRKYHPNTEELMQIIAAIAEERRNERQRCLDDVLKAWPLEALRDLREASLRGTLSMEDLQVQTVGAIKRQITEDIAARDTAPDTSSRAAQNGDTQP